MTVATLPSPTEEQFQEAVIKYAQLMGWRVAHFRPARTAKGWRTAVGADGVGYPDLTMVRYPRVIFAELKTDKGRISKAQAAWLDDLGGAGQEVYVWRPRDWAMIERMLKR